MRLVLKIIVVVVIVAGGITFGAAVAEQLSR